MTHVVRAAAVAATLFLAAGRAPAEDRKAGPVEITAEALVKECTADARKAEDRYKGKVLRVTGVVTAVHDDILYLKGGSDTVGVRYDKAKKPAVKAGDTATFDGTFDRVAVLGPTLTDGKLVAPGGARK
jgi:hypothetical protein